MEYREKGFIIDVYRTVSDEYRAYCKEDPNKQAWGWTEQQAVENLKDKHPELINAIVCRN